MKFIFVTLVFFAIFYPTLAQNNFTRGSEIEPLPKELKPGEYVWIPEVSPKGPVVVIVSLPSQEIYVYRNGVRIGRSTVSSGKEN